MTRDLTVGSPMRLIFGFTLPTLFGMLFQQFYNMMNGINKKNRIWKNEWKNFGMSLISGVMTGIAFSWDKAWWIVFFSLIPFCEVLFKEEKWKSANRSFFAFSRYFFN